MTLIDFLQFCLIAYLIYHISGIENDFKRVFKHIDSIQVLLDNILKKGDKI